MAEAKKNIPEQFGQMALGFAEIIRKIDGEKANVLKDHEAMKKKIKK